MKTKTLKEQYLDHEKNIGQRFKKKYGRKKKYVDMEIEARLGIT